MRLSLNHSKGQVDPYIAALRMVLRALTVVEKQLSSVKVGQSEPGKAGLSFTLPPWKGEERPMPTRFYFRFLLQQFLERCNVTYRIVPDGYALHFLLRVSQPSTFPDHLDTARNRLRYFLQHLSWLRQPFCFQGFDGDRFESILHFPGVPPSQVCARRWFLILIRTLTPGSPVSVGIYQNHGTREDPSESISIRTYECAPELLGFERKLLPGLLGGLVLPSR